MARRLLPIGIQTFRQIRERSCYYVDKTGYAVRLVEESTHYFLSRPRRFGKSLFLDTLKELFEGSRELFKGLHAYDRWDWSERNPVLRLSFGSGNFKEAGYLHQNLMAQFDAIDEEAGVGSRYDSGPERFGHLMRTLHRRAGQRVAVLVDEYDKPILDALEEPGVARANRDYLRGLYATIKDCDAHVRFCFLTGVSKFSKVSLFAGLNNLIDISLEPPYSAVCGYTEGDLDTVFAPELPDLDRERVRDWYSGYSWGGEEKVYNPIDALLLFRTHEFKAWWFETGYLTMLHREDRGGNPFYLLGYPNREVRQSLNASLVRYLVKDRSRQTANSIRLYDLLQAADFGGLERLFRAFFASIPYEWHTRNEIARYEGYYASIFYSYFAGLGLDVTVEESGSGGRLDMVVRLGGRVFLFEFKVVERTGPGAAMAQLKERGYADKYRHLGEPIHLVAVEFSAETRNVEGFTAEFA